MIFGAAKLVFFGFVAMTVAYLMIWIYSRSVQRESLEDQWDHAAMEGDRQAFIDEGMRRYENGLHRRLIGLVYVIPTVVFVAIIYFLNFD